MRVINCPFGAEWGRTSVMELGGVVRRWSVVGLVAGTCAAIAGVLVIENRYAFFRESTGMFRADRWRGEVLYCGYTYDGVRHCKIVIHAGDVDLPVRRDGPITFDDLGKPPKALDFSDLGEPLRENEFKDTIPSAKAAPGVR